VEGEDEEGKASIEVATKSRYQGAAKSKSAQLPHLIVGRA
jgi:hypothetical protein